MIFRTPKRSSGVSCFLIKSNGGLLIHIWLSREATQPRPYPCSKVPKSMICKGLQVYCLVYKSTVHKSNRQPPRRSAVPKTLGMSRSRRGGGWWLGVGKVVYLSTYMTRRRAQQPRNSIAGSGPPCSRHARTLTLHTSSLHRQNIRDKCCTTELHASCPLPPPHRAHPFGPQIIVLSIPSSQITPI